MIATLFPTPFEVNATFHWVVLLLLVSTALALFCVALALLLDWYEDRRQEKQAEKDATEQARRRCAIEAERSYTRLAKDALERYNRQRERAEDTYYQHAPPPRRIQ